MATVTREILIDADPDTVWTVIGDFATCPKRMGAGFRRRLRAQAA
jgi:hypothetical protein